jgi:hypothetical protein
MEILISGFGDFLIFKIPAQPHWGSSRRVYVGNQWGEEEKKPKNKKGEEKEEDGFTTEV